MPDAQSRPAPGAGSSLIVQVTDPHLFADEQGALMGINCQDSCDAVLALAQARHPQMDMLLCTGDIAQDHSLAAYQRFRARLDKVCRRQFWIAGNHDDARLMQSVLGSEDDRLGLALNLPGWSLVRLESRVDGQVYGFLSDEHLHVVAEQLRQAARAGRRVLLCTHHNPVPVAAAWLQRHALRNPEALYALLAEHACVQAVVFGHVHQVMDVVHAGVRYLGTPSTSIQFHPTEDEFTVDTCGAGYRWLRLGVDGRLETGVERIADDCFHVDFSSAGY